MYDCGELQRFNFCVIFRSEISFVYRLARTTFLSQPVFIFNAKTFNKSVNALRVAEPLLTIDRCIDRLLNTNENYKSLCGNLYNHMKEYLEKARSREHFI